MKIDGTERSPNACREESTDVSCEDHDADAARRAAEREGADRRDAWIEGSGAMSTTSGTTRESTTRSCQSTPAEARQQKLAEDSAKTSKQDRPLEDDVIGNALPGLAVGGAAGMVRGIGGLASKAATIGTERAAVELVKKAGGHLIEEGAATAIEKGGHAVVHGGHHDAHETHETHPAAEEKAPMGPPPPPEPNSCEVHPPFVVQG